MGKSGRGRLTGFWEIIFIVFVVIGISLSILQIFCLRPFGLVIFSTRYLFLLLSIFLPFVFILKPASKKAPNTYVPWYDVVLFAICLLATLYFSYYAYDITVYAWAYLGGLIPTIMSIILLLIIFEATRRSTSLAFFFIIMIFSIYPLFANKMPAIFAGHSYEFIELIRLYVMGDQSIIGLPLNVLGTLLIGFLVMGVVLKETGGGKFFMSLALAVLGRTRGGTAKVAVVSSGMFGSLSGSIISNILSTGSMTIPAMIQTGYTAVEAAAIECVASTGGMFMPPIMGAAAFIMASVLEVPYVTVAIAALVPSILYYFSLVIQVDLTAAQKGIKGWPSEDIPDLKKSLIQGWIYLGAFIVLIYYLVYLRLESRAPFIAALFLIICAMLRREDRTIIKKTFVVIKEIGLLIADLTPTFAAVGLIIGAVFMTGLGASFAREIIEVAGGNVYLLIFFGAIGSFVLGMGMTVTAAYIFLALVLSPALAAAGFEPIATHLFLLYWGMLSFITPPVAIASFAAAGMVGENPMAVGFKSMKLGAIIYFIPFFFILNPVLILRGATFSNFLPIFITALFGIVLIGGGLQGHLYYVGSLYGGVLNNIKRVLLCISGFLIMTPETYAKIGGAIILIVFLGLALIPKKLHNIISKSEA